MKGLSANIMIVALVLAAFILYTALNAQQDIGQPCTMEAKLCPDGSSVGRTGPDCGFAPCPDGAVYCTYVGCVKKKNIPPAIASPTAESIILNIAQSIGPCASTFSNSCEACKSPTVDYYTPGECPSSDAQIANPASTYCIENGGTLKILETEGGQYGVCTINGTDCEEWAHFRGECPSGP